jgi:hypothetical protein
MRFKIALRCVFFIFKSWFLINRWPSDNDELFHSRLALWRKLRSTMLCVIRQTKRKIALDFSPVTQTLRNERSVKFSTTSTRSTSLTAKVIDVHKRLAVYVICNGFAHCVLLFQAYWFVINCDYPVMMKTTIQGVLFCGSYVTPHSMRYTRPQGSLHSTFPPSSNQFSTSVPCRSTSTRSTSPAAKVIAVHKRLALSANYYGFTQCVLPFP